MLNITVTVEYLKHTVEADIKNWSNLPSEGVQNVKVTNGRSVEFGGASLYWVYPENDYWVAGCGSIRYDSNFLNEVLIFSDGTQKNRKAEFFPDILHKYVKLGWWNSNEGING